MNRKSTPTNPRPPRLRRRGAARVISESPADNQADDSSFAEHPDGWYWIAPDGHQQFGPFASRLAASADRDRVSEGAVDAAESLREAELEIGIADWIDAETGAPAEGQSPPHLRED